MRENGAVNVNDPSLWEQHAEWWQREFTDGADPEYEEQILPLIDRHLAGVAAGARHRLRGGTGLAPGRRARRRRWSGSIRPARRSPWRRSEPAARSTPGPSPTTCRAASGAFDAVVMCLVIEHIDPIEPCIHEIARVLAPGGRFLLLLNHPLLQTPGSGWIDDQILEEQYWRVGPYIHDDETLEQVAPGIDLPFMHRPLSRYVHVMGEVGLLIEDMDEPPPPPGFIASAWEYGSASTIPRLMLIRARRVE